MEQDQWFLGVQDFPLAHWVRGARGDWSVVDDVHDKPHLVHAAPAETKLDSDTSTVDTSGEPAAGDSGTALPERHRPDETAASHIPNHPDTSTDTERGGSERKDRTWVPWVPVDPDSPPTPCVAERFPQFQPTRLTKYHVEVHEVGVLPRQARGALTFPCAGRVSACISLPCGTTASHSGPMNPGAPLRSASAFEYRVVSPVACPKVNYWYDMSFDVRYNYHSFVQKLYRDTHARLFHQ